MFFFSKIRYLLVKTKFMKRIIHLNEGQLKDLIQKVIDESKKDKNFIQKLSRNKKKKELVVNLVSGVKKMD